MSEYKELERDGHIIRIYDNGMERNMTTNRMIRPPSHALITPEKANVYQRRRQEKQARLLRERITQAHNANMPTRASGSAEAFAESGAMLYENVVLNADAYPRDRLEVWEKLGKYAHVLPSDIRKVDADADGITQSVADGVAVALERVARDVMARRAGGQEIAEGQVTEEEVGGTG